MFTFLGTSAGEQFPGIWCNCPNCRKARQLGGNNIRRNTCAALGRHTLIDFGPAIPLQVDEAGLSLPEIETILVTHNHEDHFHPWYLRWRHFTPDRPTAPEGHEMGPLFSKPKWLTIYGNASVEQAVRERVANDWENHHLAVEVVEPRTRYTTAQLAFTPVEANHDPKQDCLNYIIEYRGRTIFYATDTAWFKPETRKYLEQFTFDMVVMEGTFGFNDSYDVEAPGHCNFYADRRAREWMQAAAMVHEDTLFAITHTGPHHAPPFEETAPILEKWGLTLAHDGMKVEWDS